MGRRAVLAGLAVLSSLSAVVALQPAVRGAAQAPAIALLPPGLAYVQQQQLVAPDAAAQDGFGYSVALSTDGNVALVGAPSKGTPGGAGASGAAYLFVRSGGTWNLQQELLDPNGRMQDSFGWSVALSGDGTIAAVAAPFAGGSGAGPSMGTVYVFVRGGNTWNPQQVLTGADATQNDNFGYSIALSSDGGTLLVGDTFATVDQRPNAGAAYVFTNGANGWTEQAKLTASDAVESRAFGASVALSVDGSTALVGACCLTGGPSTGEAYVFTNGASSWNQEQILQSESGASSDQFGSSVALSATATTALVGSPDAETLVFAGTPGTLRQQQKLSQPSTSVTLTPDGGTALLGSGVAAAFTYVSNNGSWSQEQAIAGTDTVSSDQFGAAVALSADANTLLVGARARNSFTGATYVFVPGTPLTAIPCASPQQLLASDGAANDEFGLSVALSGDGNTALVGSPINNHFFGAAYVFVRSGCTWTQQQQLTASNPQNNNRFGVVVALSADGQTALVGTILGSQYVYTRNGATWTQQAVLTTPAGSNGMSVALSADGGTALVGGGGNTVTGVDVNGAGYIFIRSGTTWSQQARLTASDGQLHDALGSSGALSADGNTTILGAPLVIENTRPGAAYVFTRSGGTWTQQQKLTASDAVNGDSFGHAVAMSGDGRTILVSPLRGPTPSGGYVFARSGATWSQQAKLAGVGAAAALSADGNVGLLVTEVFTRSGSSWSQQQTLTAPNAVELGFSVALSADGGTALEGDIGANTSAGAAYVFTLSTSSIAPTATATPAATLTSTPTPTVTATPSSSATPTTTATASRTVTATPTATLSSTARRRTRLFLETDALPGLYGLSTRFIADVSTELPPGPASSGSVTFSEDTPSGRTALQCDEGPQPRPIAPNGETPCTTSALPAGRQLISAIYAGDSHFFPSLGTLNQDIQPVETLAGVDAPTQSQVGQPVIFRADAVSENRPGSGLAPGNFTFSDTLNGATTPMSCDEGPQPRPVDNSLGATCTTGGLTAGHHVISVVFDGGPNFSPSATTTFEDVAPRETGVDACALHESCSDESDLQQRVTFDALVAVFGPNSGALTGGVTFTDSVGGTAAQLNCDEGPQPRPVPANGFPLPCSTSALTPGRHLISAVYDGRPNFSPAVGTFIQDVGPTNGFTTSTLLAPPSTVATFGDPLSFVAQVSSIDTQSPVPGEVIFFDTFDGTRTTLGCTEGPLPEQLVGGQATCSVANAGSGHHLIEAIYEPAPGYLASIDSIKQDVQAVETQITTVNQPAPVNFGRPVMLQARVVASRTLTPVPGHVTFLDAFDGQRNPVQCDEGSQPRPLETQNGMSTATCTLSSALPGRHVIEELYESGPDYLASASVVVQDVVPWATNTNILPCGGPARAFSICAGITGSPGAPPVPPGPVLFMDTFNGTTTPLQCSEGPKPEQLQKGGAQCTRNVPSSGDHLVTVIYEPPPGFLPSIGSVDEEVP